MGTHPIFESDFDCLTAKKKNSDMQITIKTLKNSVFKIESELDVDVADFKKKVEEHDKECPHAQQKLIYQGKVMEDGKKLADYNLTEKGYRVNGYKGESGTTTASTRA